MVVVAAIEMVVVGMQICMAAIEMVVVGMQICMAAEGWWMVARCESAAAARQLCKELETLKELDAKTSNSTRRCRRKFNNAMH
jgi:hypothetical protein